MGHTNGVAIHDSACWHLRLGDRLLRLKLDAAREYAELRSEVEQAVALKGKEYFRIECLRKAASITEHPKEHRPHYEKFGEQRVAAGKYRAAIRYESHMLPVLRAIQDHAATHQPAGHNQNYETKTMKAES
jgi:hypothetical protein